MNVPSYSSLTIILLLLYLLYLRISPQCSLPRDRMFLAAYKLNLSDHERKSGPSDTASYFGIGGTNVNLDYQARDDIRIRSRISPFVVDQDRFQNVIIVWARAIMTQTAASPWHLNARSAFFRSFEGTVDSRNLMNPWFRNETKQVSDSPKRFDVSLPLAAASRISAGYLWNSTGAPCMSSPYQFWQQVANPNVAQCRSCLWMSSGKLN